MIDHITKQVILVTFAKNIRESPPNPAEGSAWKPKNDTLPVEKLKSLTGAYRGAL